MSYKQLKRKIDTFIIELRDDKTSNRTDVCMLINDALDTLWPELEEDG